MKSSQALSQITNNNPPNKRQQLDEDNSNAATTGRVIKWSENSTVIIAILTSCWYYSSSITAISTQLILNKQNQDNDGKQSEVILASLILTSLQLLIGSAVGKLTFYLVSYYYYDSPSSSFIKGRYRQSQKQYPLGLLHGLGCICTNIGFGFGSASLVQIVKLLEPIETLILCVVVHMTYLGINSFTETISQIVPFRKAFATLIIISGTFMLLSQKSLEFNTYSLLFALGSGMCMSLRNVIKKNSEKRSDKKHNVPQTIPNGTQDFLSITISATVPTVLITIVALVYNHQLASSILYKIINNNSGVLIKAVFCHCIYNMASISVLGFTSAPAHSLLNVGKRIINVLAATMFFHLPLSFVGKIGMLVAATGALLYNDMSGSILVLKLKQSRKYRYCTMVMVAAAVVVQFLLYNATLPGGKIEEKGIRNIALWTYPSLPSKEHIGYDEYEWICAYDDACPNSNNSISINLVALTQNSPPTHQYLVQHHMYYKVLHGMIYPHHIQSIALCALMMDDQSFNKNANIKSYLKLTTTVKDCQSYDPTDASTLPLVQENFDTQSREFLTYTYDSRVQGVGVANSGDEMQSLANIQFLPYISRFVDRVNELPSVDDKGLLISNAWHGDSNWKFPPNTFTGVSFISVHISGAALGTAARDLQYWHEYTRQVGPVGARDSSTLHFLQSKGIAAYLSSCFTLMFQLPKQLNEQRNEILIVDVDPKMLPDWVSKNATILECNVPRNVRQDRLKRFQYAHNLLSTYASRAKVVITSRIHSALPSAALGIPVIFVDSKNLPGGGGGRTTGISDLFHLHNPHKDEFKWTLNDLNRLGPNPGVHQIDRYRASHLKHLTDKSSIYTETAKLYGMLPLQRLGKGVWAEEETHDLFHFILTTGREKLNWKMIRAIEYVFYHHPNAKVLLHSNTFQTNGITEFDLFQQTGYDLQIQPYSIEELLSECLFLNQTVLQLFLEKLPNLKKGKYWYSHQTDILRFLLMYKFGGAYFDTDMYIQRPLPKSLMNVVGKEGGSLINGAAMIFEPQHPMMIAAIEYVVSNYNKAKANDWGFIGPKLITKLVPAFPNIVHVMNQTAFEPFGYQKASLCFTDAYDFPNKYKLKNTTYAVHLNNKMTNTYTHTAPKSLCDEMLHKYCIFCNKVHTTRPAKISE